MGPVFGLLNHFSYLADWPRHISWGVTLANIDVDDLFIERFTGNHTYEYQRSERMATVRKEKIYVKGKEEPYIEEVVEVRFRTADARISAVTRPQTVHGPIISHYLGVGEQSPAISVRSWRWPSDIR